MNSPCLDLKPAAGTSGGASKKVVGAQSSLKSNGDDDDGLSQLEDFICAICLDKPDNLVDLAKISGCTHKFCFDCIDKVSFIFIRYTSFFNCECCLFVLGVQCPAKLMIFISSIFSINNNL